MEERTHTDDLRDVQEGDRVTFETTTGDSFEADCVSREVQNADPRTGEIRKTTFWEFQAHDVSVPIQIFASVIDGLKSSPNDPDFPIHNEALNTTAECNIGYITEIENHEEVEV